MDIQENILMGKYELGRLLGQGTFAKVYYARNLTTGLSVAIKVIDKDKVSRIGLINQIKREISIMKRVKHPNILQLYEVMATKTKIYFALEYAKGGELFNKVAKGRLKEQIARKYFQQLINAIDFCHSRGVYHRDLKPENLLLDDNENLKVSDFGLSALAESRREDGLLHTTCGTPAYVAPEVINRRGYDGDKADVWSCGVILYVLLAGYLPFHDSNLLEMYRKIGKSEFRFPNWFPLEARKLVLRILDPNPVNRITIPKIKESSWFKKGKRNETEYKSSTDGASGSTTTMENQDSMRPANMNAFDIISLSPGFDLTTLFEEPRQKKEARFTIWRPGSDIISKIEEIGKVLGMKVRKREAGLLKLEAVTEGRKGILSIDAEIFELTPSFHLVEVRKCNGDTLEYQKVVNEGLRPGLEEINWDPQQVQPEQQEVQLTQQDHVS